MDDLTCGQLSSFPNMVICLLYPTRQSWGRSADSLPQVFLEKRTRTHAVRRGINFDNLIFNTTYQDVYMGDLES